MNAKTAEQFRSEMLAVLDYYIFVNEQLSLDAQGCYATLDKLASKGFWRMEGLRDETEETRRTLEKRRSDASAIRRELLYYGFPRNRFGRVDDKHVIGMQKRVNTLFMIEQKDAMRTGPEILNALDAFRLTIFGLKIRLEK